MYNEQQQGFSHTFLWPDEDAERSVIDRSLTLATAHSVNPIDAELLDSPFSATGAHWLYARYSRHNDIPGNPMIKVGEFSAHRLTGGWRIYRRADGQPASSPLESINEDAGGMVFLVSDSTAVVHTTEDLASHERILSSL